MSMTINAGMPPYHWLLHNQALAEAELMEKLVTSLILH